MSEFCSSTREELEAMTKYMKEKYPGETKLVYVVQMPVMMGNSAIGVAATIDGALDFTKTPTKPIQEMIRANPNNDLCKFTIRVVSYKEA